MNLGKVVAVRCPLCGWTRRYKGSDANPDRFFNSPLGDVILIEQVGGKHKRSFADLDSGIIRRGRGSARGRIEVREAVGLADLDPKLKERIRERAREIIERI